MLCVPRAPCVPLVLLFFFAPLCLYRPPSVKRRGVTSNVSFLSGTSPFAFAVCMSPIVILPGTIFWTIFRRKLTFLFPLCCAATLIRFSTGLWIGVALTRLTHLAKVLLPFVASSTRVAWWTFSSTCIRLHPGSRGPNGTVPLPRASTLSAFLPCGSLPSRPAPWCPVLFQITAGSRSLSRSLTSFPPVQACGNLTLPS